MDRFWKMAEQSTLTSGLLAVVLVGTACYCAVMQIPLPDFLALALGTVIGFFFGGKVEKAVRERVG